MILKTDTGKYFLVAESNYKIELDWNEAINTSLLLGQNWRLPTKEELYLIYLNKDALKIKEEGAYWSSSETEELHIQTNSLGFEKGKSKNAWLLDFTNGEWVDFVQKNTKFKIRFVKDQDE